MKQVPRLGRPIRFPVFHWKHPCLQPSDSSSPAQLLHPDAAALLPELQASPVVADDTIHKGKFLMVISLGTPAIYNLVTIDTGSTLSWVQCRPCQVTCKTFAAEAGPTFDPRNSTTYQRAACSSRDCAAAHELAGVPFGCEQETDTCLYSLRTPWAGCRLGKDRLGLTLARELDDDALDDFIFGCSEDVRFGGREAGIVGFGNDRLSFVNQVMTARQATTSSNSYNAFSYCFPGDHNARGFLSIGPYARDDGLAFTNLVFGYGQDRSRRPFVYSLQQLDMAVDGRRLDVDDPQVYTAQMMIVDSGTQATFLLAPVFDALDKAVTAAMSDKGYARVELPNDEEHKVCFVVTTDTVVDWSDLPTVEMKFTGTTLKLPPQNAFNERFVDADRLLCMPFQPRDAGVSGVQILGNRVTRSFRVVFDLQARMLGFQPDAC
ncbi:hypothetical protein EJB05_40683, partial [Eragrostis curvula]